MIRMTVFAGPGLRGDLREPSARMRFVSERDLPEVLRAMALEYSTADYFGGRQVVITLDPHDQDAEALRGKLGSVRGIIERASEALEA